MYSQIRDAIGRLPRYYRIFLLVLSAPVILSEYFHPDTGKEYGIGLPTKLLLAGKILRNNRDIQTGSTFVEHLIIATKILNVPRDAEGCIVECGCYKGGSTANLSLVAGLVGRRLEVFDSFEGMPKPSEQDREHNLVASNRVHTYDEGAWRAPLDEAQANIERYGDISVCNFNVGYFEETMPTFDEECAVVFLDVGLRDSAETCLRYLWPLLREDGYLFTHEAKHMEITSLFFDREWWHENLNRDPPGLVGGGSGLGLHPHSNGFASLLGYSVKNPGSHDFETVADSGEGENCVSVTITKND